MKKTILIPIFQGVEAKNILRTGIFSGLRRHQDIRIVLLVSDQVKKEYFGAEFYGDNIIYEVVGFPRQSFLERFFSSLKKHLVWTETMDIKRRQLFRPDRPIRYFFEWVLNRVLANRPTRKVIRFLDRVLVRDDRSRYLFDRYEPELVFLAHLFGDEEISLLREARRRNVRSVGLINSWDKITSRGMVRLLPDKLVVHNELIKNDAIKYLDMSPDDVIVTGIPHFDNFVFSRPSSKNVFFKAIGADLNSRLLLFCPLGKSFSSLDVKYINLLLSIREKGFIPKDIQIIVRFPPNDDVELDGLKSGEGLIFERPGKRFGNERGLDWDMNSYDAQRLLDTLFYSSLVVCPPSSMSIDAAFFDKPVINICFEEDDDAYGRINDYYEMTHYKKILDTRGVRLVYNQEDLIYWVNSYLERPEIDRAGRDSMVKQQCWKTDGKSGERVAVFVLKLLSL